MLNEHPSVEELTGFLRGHASASGGLRNPWIVRHLLASCPTCRDRLETLGWPGQRLARLVCLPGRNPDDEIAAFERPEYDYDQAFANVERAVSEHLAEEPSRFMSAVVSDPVDSVFKSASPELVLELIEQSHAARYEAPDEMLRLASFARNAAESCAANSSWSAAELADLRAQAWAQLGNALRVSGRMPDAEEAFGEALRYCTLGTGDLYLRGRLHEQMVSLFTFERRFDSAVNESREAEHIYEELGETHSLARTLVQKAIAFLYAGETEQAVHVLNRAIPLIDHHQDPHLLLAACHNLIRCYIDLDRPEQALSLYFDARGLYTEFKDALIQLRAAWQEGQLLRDVGYLQSAEAALARARTGFMERGLAYEVAVVSLDLAAVYVKLGLVQKVKETVASALPIFQALQVGRETLASLLQLQQVADQEQQALELIRTLTARLDNISSRPMLK